jgi:hypothetical protein
MGDTMHDFSYFAGSPCSDFLLAILGGDSFIVVCNN